MKTLILKSKGMGRYDDVSPFLVENEMLEIKIELPATCGEFFFVGEINGKSLGALPVLKGGTVTLKGLTAGELHAEVKHYLRGEIIETYKVEPLLLKEIDKTLSAMPEIAALMAECAELRKRADELTKGLQRQKDESTREINKLVVAFLSFSYAEYQGDVQLNSKNLTAEGFSKVFGYESEIKKISEEL